MRKVYIVGGNSSYLKFIDNSEEVHIISDADIVLFTGGEDVSPSFYGEEMHPRTYTNFKRDSFESREWYAAICNLIPMIGICRGAQFLTVMAGGKLVQDVNNHSIYGTHEIEMGIENKKYQITSTHHQMMNPYLLDSEDYKVLAVSSPSLSDFYRANTKHAYNMLNEPEIVYYPVQNGLAIQGHPEQMETNAPIVREINMLITKMISNGRI